MMGNSAFLDNTLQVLIDTLKQRLPRGWRVLPAGSTRGRGSVKTRDVLKIRGPSGDMGALVLDMKPRLEPKDVENLTDAETAAKDAPRLIVAPFISRRTQE